MSPPTLTWILDGGFAAGFDLIVSLQAVHGLHPREPYPEALRSAPQSATSRRNHFDLRSRHSSSPSAHRAAHFMTVEEHLSTFQKVGFINAREICPAADLSLMAAEKKPAQ